MDKPTNVTPVSPQTQPAPGTVPGDSPRQVLVMPGDGKFIVTDPMTDPEADPAAYGYYHAQG